MITGCITYALYVGPSQLHALRNMHEEEERTAQGYHPGALRTENVEVALLILKRPTCEWFSGLRCFATKRCLLSSFLSHLEYKVA